MPRVSLALAACAATLCGSSLLFSAPPDGGCGNCPCNAPTTKPADPAGVSETQAKDLLAMRREEKLAHDVYVALGQKHPNVMPFQRIPRSEQMHQDAMHGLLGRYAIADPVEKLAAGEFADDAVKQLHDELVERGQASVEAALAVGAEIEELDIRDLRLASARATQQDIRDVYAALEGASHNHLRAFMRNLTTRGATYAPKYLTQTEFDAIVNGDHGQHAGPASVAGPATQPSSPGRRFRGGRG